MILASEFIEYLEHNSITANEGSAVGLAFVKELAEDGYDVIVRPHPHSRVFEPDFIETCLD